MLSLCITGFDGDPDEITAILGIIPTSTRRRGERGPSGRPSSFNGWWFDAYPPRIADGGFHDDAMCTIIRLLDGRAEQFARLRDRFNPTMVTVYGGLYHQTDDQCGLWLDPNQMRVLADCGVSWGLDLFGETSLTSTEADTLNAG